MPKIKRHQSHSVKRYVHGEYNVQQSSTTSYLSTIFEEEEQGNFGERQRTSLNWVEAA